MPGSAGPGQRDTPGASLLNISQYHHSGRTHSPSIIMSHNNWVSFEDSAVTSAQPQPLTSASIHPHNINSVMIPKNPFHEPMSHEMSHVQDSSTRYSVFDKIRQEELRGGDLGWSEEILGSSPANEKAAIWPSSQSETRTAGFRGSGA